MNNLLRTRNVWTRVAVLATLLGAFMVLGWQFLPGNAWNPRGPMIIDPQLATEFWEDRKLVGFWDAVFFGKVTSDGVYSDAYPYPTKTFDVEVLESLKGEAAGTVQVNQPADVTQEGDPIYFEHGGSPLVNGQAYVFVGAKDPAQGLYLVHTTYQQVNVPVPAGSNKEEILQSDHAGVLRARFQDAIDNQIAFDPWAGVEEEEEPDDSDERDER